MPKFLVVEDANESTNFWFKETREEADIRVQECLDAGSTCELFELRKLRKASEERLPLFTPDASQKAQVCPE